MSTITALMGSSHYFRAFTGAVTLKRLGCTLIGKRALDFRAFTGAVTLKHIGGSERLL